MGATRIINPERSGKGTRGPALRLMTSIASLVGRIKRLALRATTRGKFSHTKRPASRLPLFERLVAKGFPRAGAIKGGVTGDGPPPCDQTGVAAGQRGDPARFGATE